MWKGCSTKALTEALAYSAALSVSFSGSSSISLILPRLMEILQSIFRAQRDDFPAIFHSCVAGDGVNLGFLTVEEFAGFGDVRNVGGGDHDGVDKSAVPAGADVGFHSEMSFVAFAGLVHFGVALLFPGLGGGRSGDERGVHKRALAHHQAAG